MQVLPLRGCAGSDSSASNDELRRRSGFLSFWVVRLFFVRSGAESVESMWTILVLRCFRVSGSGLGLPTFPQPHPAAASAAARFGEGVLEPASRGDLHVAMHRPVVGLRRGRRRDRDIMVEIRKFSVFWRRAGSVVGSGLLFGPPSFFGGGGGEDPSADGLNSEFSRRSKHGNRL